MESLYMGCVSYSQRYFLDGKVSKSALRQADLAARAEVQAIAGEFSADHWQQAIGSSGTAKALAEILQMNGYSDGITPAGLDKLRSAMLKAGDCNKLQLEGLRPDRVPVLAGGFAIMAAAVDELGIARMGVADGALREGVLYDLLGRFQRHDMRETTVRQFMRRYHVDPVQAGHVGLLAADLLRQLAKSHPIDLDAALLHLAWAARLHEIGLSIAHSGYHKHSAYIIENADMPGFSKKEQARLAKLVLAQRGSLNKIVPLVQDPQVWAMIAALRLAVLLYRSRLDIDLPELALTANGAGFELQLDADWLAQNPLTETALEAEAREWKGTGLKLAVARK
jgi:exopolyphosphatase/guanosine-5'-triphosphate,3'-diphosphate pyrophosphatase